MRRKDIYALAAATVLFGGWLLLMPRDPFRGVSYSTVVTDRDGRLLGARTSDDGMWRFPERKDVPERYAKALIQFEDKYFRYHDGVNPAAIARALAGNIRSGRITSGGSTITMQVVRLSHPRKRNLWNKIREAIMARRLEFGRSKDRILAMYASHAPFGGNVVGLDAAAWRYFGVRAEDLSWAEAATLAVLPNAPSSINPGKGRDELTAKRNRLLGRLLAHGDIDSLTYGLSCSEPLPDAPLPMPRLARHMVEGFHASRHGEMVRSPIIYDIQVKAEEICDRMSGLLSEEGIDDLCAVIMDVQTGETVAYVGNSCPERKRNGRDVDIALRPRSTGSILKPLLYCAALQDGLILPGTLLPDIPVNIGGFSPQNFDMQYYGAVPAKEALARSLNVPSVFLLRDYGVAKFHSLLRECGFNSLTHDADWYGLSLILGGGEASLMEVAKAYRGMAAQYCYGGDNSPLNDRIALWHILQALSDVSRPDELDWRNIASLRRAAWKTGTSFGFRDAWAVGMTPEWVVGVWAGNADGHGVPSLTGARCAAPVMFSLLGMLPQRSKWFQEPLEGGVSVQVCSRSGHLKGPWCAQSIEQYIPRAALQSDVCPYHSLSDGKSVFRLPPAMEWYYKPYHPEYEGYLSSQGGQDQAMQFIYPQDGSEITLTRQLDGSEGSVVIRLAHRNRNTVVYWHMDGSYLGETTGLHQMTVSPAAGPHVLTAVDRQGNSTSVSFKVR